MGVVWEGWLGGLQPEVETLLPGPALEQLEDSEPVCSQQAYWIRRARGSKKREKQRL